MEGSDKASSPGSESLPQQQQQQQDEPRPLAPSPVSSQANDAARLFQAQRYTECLAILHQLLQKKEDDPKVLHNIAITEYYQDGCSDPQKLLDVLAKVKGRSEELARAAEEQLEGLGTPSSGTRSNSGASATATQGQSAASPAGSEGDAVAYMEDYDTSIPTLNTAVILYHLQQYAAALAVLEPLYSNIEPIDEAAALRVCLLMLDITLQSGQPAKAAAALQTMEKTFGYLLSPAEGGGAAQSQPSSQSQLLTSVGTGLSMTDSGTGLSSLVVGGELGLPRTSSEEVLDEEALSLSLDVEGSGVRSSSPVPVSSGMSMPSVEKVLPAPVVELKLMLHLYKVRLLMLTRNLKATKREVKSALNLSRDHLKALLLKAQLEYSRANYRKAVKLLTTCSSRVEGGKTAMFFSNLGCIHHQLRKDQTAVIYFRKALTVNAATAKESPMKLNAFSQDKSSAILYNAGLQQLICGNPILAASCFQQAGLLYYNQPLLWLRLAECCILALEKGLLEPNNDNNTIKREDVKVSVIGEGKWRRVVLPAGSLNPTAAKVGLDLESSKSEEGMETEKVSDMEINPEPSRQHKLSMSYARHCLHMALHLVDKREAKAAEAAAAVAAEVAESKEGEETATSATSQNQKNGTGDKKSNPAGTGAGSQVSPNGDAKENKVTSGSSGTVTAAIAAYEEEKRKEQVVIRQTALTDLAYVELCLENPSQVLKTVAILLSQQDCPQMCQFLARMYAAEALCLLDRPREAADYLSACLVESLVAEQNTTGGEDDGTKWKSGDNSEASGDGEDPVSVSPITTLPDALNVSKVTGSRARASLYINLAAVHVMQGDLSQAQQWASQAVAISPSNPLAVLAVVYVELLRGRREEALSMLKHCRHLCVVSPNKVLWQRD
ncbi:hypothetical protein R1sor_007899 [Riccia sorocarpa]|uniref:CCR4-NOT transcription complex subunit 10 n=1 Tax=Riccia sorocarpa TaxID=122646 RepID=A0ABD3HRU9_9MARC